MRLRTVQMQTEGDYLPTDVDWNNKDVPHLNHVHSLVDDVTCVIERDVQASISLQKVLGITFPLILVHYDSGPNHQTHFVTILAWTMVTDHEFIPLSPTRTRAVTTYTVAARPFWMLFFPFIKALLQKNYRTLMSEDVPLRERRGWLRSIGYTFRGDDGPRDIRNSLPIGANNVLAPEPPTGETPVFAPVPLGDLDAGWTYLGRSDHLGLKLTREGDRIVAYARMCGWTLARAHARSGDAVAISAYLGSSDAFDRALVTFGESYADQNERDYDALRAAAEAERVRVVAGL